MTTELPQQHLDLYALGDGVLLTERDLAAALGIAPKTLRNWRTRPGVGPAWRNIGGALVRYRAGDVTAWIGDSPRG